MQMLIANTGRTGKENSIIFDTDKKIWGVTGIPPAMTFTSTPRRRVM